MAKNPPKVIVGVDTHKEFHMVAIVAETGKEVASKIFLANKNGYTKAFLWVKTFGEPLRVGIEATGSYGKGICKHFQKKGIEVLDVYKPDKQERRRCGKDDTRDAFQAASAALAYKRCAPAKESSELFLAASLTKSNYDQAVKHHTASINALKAHIIKLPDKMRISLERLSNAELIGVCLGFRIRSEILDPKNEIKKSLRLLALRIASLEKEISLLKKELEQYAKALAPNTLSLFGVGAYGAITFLCCAGQNISRIKSESAFSMLCGASPISVSSGNNHHHRLNRGGDRKANAALYTMAITRMKFCETTQTYIAKKMSENKTKKDAIRILKRHLTREVFWSLKQDLSNLVAID